MPTPVLCVDMDGTLLSEQGQIHPNDREILHDSDSLLIIPTTGRPLHSVQRRFAKNGLWLEQSLPLPLVLDNGCAIYRPQKELVKYTPFAPELQEALLEILWDHRRLSFALIHPEEVHYPWPPSQYANRFFTAFDFNAFSFSERSRRVPFARITMISEDLEPIERFVEATSHLPVETTSSMQGLCEIMPAGRHKAQGLLDLLQALEIEDPFICAAGDGGNDLEIFDLSQRSFAPLTSPPEIQERADQVVDVEKNGLLQPMLEMLQSIR